MHAWLVGKRLGGLHHYMYLDRRAPWLVLFYTGGHHDLSRDNVGLVS